MRRVNKPDVILWLGQTRHIGLKTNTCGVRISDQLKRKAQVTPVSRPGHTKDHHKNGTNCLPAWHAMREGWSLAVQPDCLKGRVVCGTVYGDMHLKDLLGSIVRVGYCIPVLDFYLVLHDLRCRKSTIMD